MSHRRADGLDSDIAQTSSKAAHFAFRATVAVFSGAALQARGHWFEPSTAYGHRPVPDSQRLTIVKLALRGFERSPVGPVATAVAR